jgi:hypothetical protein
MTSASRLVVTLAALAISAPASPTEFDDYSAAFKAQVRSSFAVEPSEAWTRKAAFARRDFLARTMEKVASDAAPVLEFSAQGEPLELESPRWIVETASWDCSVNGFCGRCDDEGIFTRGPCELARAGCALALSPAIGVCAAGKAMNGTELARLDLSGGRLSVTGEARQFRLSIDPKLDSAKANPSVTASATVRGLRAQPHLHFVLGIFTACPFPPSIAVPTIAVSTSNARVDVKASVAVEAVPEEAPEAIALSLELSRVEVVADVNTGDVFAWIGNNPLALLVCPLPALAGFAGATTISHQKVPLLPQPISTSVGQLRLKRGGTPLPIVPKITEQSIGLVEGDRPVAAL